MRLRGRQRDSVGLAQLDVDSKVRQKAGSAAGPAESAEYRQDVGTMSNATISAAAKRALLAVPLSAWMQRKSFMLAKGEFG